MRQLKMFPAVAAALALAGCTSTRGAQDLFCPAFDQFVEVQQTSDFVADIQCEQFGDVCPATGRQDTLLESTSADSLTRALRLSVATDQKAGEGPGRNHLLLSGGGQWGAFGAGLFGALHDTGQLDGLDIGTVTGVSTGGLQALLLSAALDPAQSAAVRREAIARLKLSYDPPDERTLVNRNWEPLLVFTGSVAGTTPLRRQVLSVLCGKDGSCPMIAALQSGSIDTFIGFVEGRSGQFRYLAVRKVLDSTLSDPEKAECLAAGAMASSAMPVFHQQMRVTGGADGPRTLFDGGVRQSVFLAGFGETLHQATKAEVSKRAMLLGAASPPMPRPEDYPTIYVVRNGPTTRPVDTAVDKVKSAEPQGRRAYDLIVNELEIGSIAHLRLANPTGPIKLTTADGWDKAVNGKPRCDKPAGPMFAPGFMRCLQALGAEKATRAGGPWWPLSTLP